MRTNKMLAFATAAIAFAASAMAANYNIDWLQMTPTSFGNAPPFNGNYTLPGVGAVQMTYSAHADFTEARFQNPLLVNGNLNVGPDNYAWNNHEMLARTNWGFSGVLNSSWFVTYTFSGTIPAGQLVVGVAGLGRRNPNPGENAADCMTTATCLQNGTYFGDWTNGGNWGATAYTGGPGIFSMTNSVTGNGGQDPWWNTGLAVVRIDDAVNSITVRFDHTMGDGAGVNIGVIVPEPASAALLGAGTLLFGLRRRR